jgi:hypothetical protein
MCDKESFARIRDAIGDLQKADAVQSEQIKTLFHTTEKQGENMTAQNNRLIMAIIGVLLILVLAVVFGALGERGFNSVTKAAPALATKAPK